MVDGGNKQYVTTDMEYSASPTRVLQPVLLTSKIDAEEGRDMEIIDIPKKII